MKERSPSVVSIVLGVSIVAGFGSAFLPLGSAAATYAGVVGAQVALGSVLLVRRRSALASRAIWAALIGGMICSGVAALVLGPAFAGPDVDSWNGAGLALILASVVLHGVAGGLLTQPLLGVAALRRPIEIGLGGFAAVGVARVWAAADRTHNELIVLAVIAGIGAVCLGVAAFTTNLALSELGRSSELYIIRAAVAFAVLETVLLIVRLTSLTAPLFGSGMIIVFGLLLAAMCHPHADVVGRPLRHLSDRVTGRASSLAFAAVLLVDGLVAALSRVSDQRSIIVILGCATAVQFIVLTWAIGSWIESGAAKTWLANRRLVSDLRNAIIRNEIAPHYQPIVRTSDGVRVGYEALARWDHPVLGVLSAVRFIGLAEACGYLAEIDRHILLTAARNMVELTAPLRAADEPFVTVNLSPLRLMQAGFAEEIVASLAREGVSADGLIIEMTEASEVTDWKALSTNLVHFQAAGIGLAVDDFGSGHANLGLICQFDADMIKLDRALVELAMETPRGAAVVHGAIQTARATGALVVAEGVSNSVWIAELANLGVDFVQGYAIGYPQPIASLNQRMPGSSEIERIAPAPREATASSPEVERPAHT